MIKKILALIFVWCVCSFAVLTGGSVEVGDGLDYPDLTDALNDLGTLTENCTIDVADAIVNDTGISNNGSWDFNGYNVYVRSATNTGGNPKTGTLINVTNTNSWITFRPSGVGKLEISGFRFHQINSSGANTAFFVTASISSICTLSIHDNIMDGNGFRPSAFYLIDDTPFTRVYSNLCVDFNTVAIRIGANVTGKIQHNTVGNSGRGIRADNTAYTGTALNCVVVGSYNGNDYDNLTSFTLTKCASEDASGSSGLTGLTIANIFESIDSADGADFYLPREDSALYGAGNNPDSYQTEYLNEETIESGDVDIGAKGLSRVDGVSGTADVDAPIATSSGSGGVSVDSSNIYILGIGQSNMSGEALNTPKTERLSDNILMWDTTGDTTKLLEDPTNATGEFSLMPKLCNDIWDSSQTDTVIAVNLAKGGTSLTNWLDQSANGLFKVSMRQLRAAMDYHGNGVVYPVYYQGEADIGAGLTKEQMAQKLDSVIQQYRDSLGENIVWTNIIIGHAGSPGSANDEDWRNRRGVTIDASDGVKTFHCQATDLKYTGIHLETRQLDTVGTRAARCINYARGLVDDWRGPYVSSGYTSNDRQNIRIDVTNNIGALTFVDSMTGFRLFDSEGDLTVDTSYVSGNELVFGLDRRVRGNTYVGYLDVQFPDQDGTVYDANNFLPLEIIRDTNQADGTLLITDTLPLNIVSITPDSGVDTGGYSVEFLTSGFDSVETVTVGDSTWGIDSFTLDTVWATAKTYHEIGDIAVTLTDTGGESASGSFEYYCTDVVSVDPASGLDTLGGEAVIILGRAFGVTQGASTVTFGGTPAASYTHWSDDSLVVVSPAKDKGPYNLIVTITNLGADTASVYFGPAPAIMNRKSGLWIGHGF